MHLNIWTQQHTKWLNILRWDKCAGEVDALALKKKEYYGGFEATEMVAKLMDDRIQMVEFRQTIQAFNEPTQKLEALITAERIEHGGHPVLRAHAQAVTIKTELNENIRPVKDKTTGRIDGIVALIMALSRATQRRRPCEPRAFVLEW